MITVNKREVNFNLEHKLRTEIVSYKNLIVRELGNDFVSVYLFGSIAKGNYSVNSDVDLLALIKGIELTPRVKKDLRCKIRDISSDLMKNYNFSKELDCKVYGEIDFLRSSSRNNFEKQIVSDLVDVTNWRIL